MSPIPFPFRASALMLALALATSQANALTMGELRTRSFIGQPLRTSVSYRISPEEAHPLPRCLSLQAIPGDLPLPAPVQIRVNEQDQSIEILSSNAINEPIIGFVLQSSCESQNFSRSYTVFLDPEPVISVPAIIPASEPAITPAAVTPSPEPATNAQPAAEPAPAPPAPVKRPPRQIVVDEDISPTDLASRYYPVGSKRYKQLVRNLYAANPGVVTPDAPIPAGTKLRTRIPAPPKPVMASSPATTPKPAVKPKSASKGEDRLTLVTEDPVTGRITPRTEKREDPLRALETEVSSMKDLQLKMETEIKSLRQSVADLAKSTATALATASATASTAEETAAKSNKTATSPGKTGGVPLWLWLAGGLVCVGGLSYWLGRRGQIASGYTVRHGATGHKTVAEINPFDTRPGIAREPVTEASIMKQNPDAIEVEEDESDIDRAQFLLAEGEVEEAIALLYKAIEENEQDVERWLILFHIFRERMMKTEYMQLAQRFHQLPPEEEDWDLVCNLGRKIDPDNPVYAHTHPTQTVPVFAFAVKDEPPLDLLSAEAANKIAPPAAVNLDLPPLDLGAPLFDDAPNTMPPQLPDDKNSAEATDDFSKPCRY